MDEHTTIVTCYFKGLSKYDPELYTYWIQNFVHLKSNIIIFSNNPLQFDGKDNIKIYEYGKFYVDRYNWEYHKTLDVEEYHNVNLYRIWNEKTFMIEEAIRLNPYRSKYFFWVDIGCIRSPEVLMEVINFPTNLEKYVDIYGGFILSLIEDFTSYDKKFIDGISVSFRNVENRSCPITDRIQGGFFGGSINKCLDWIQIYKDELELFMDQGVFAGKEQNIMSNICLKYQIPYRRGYTEHNNKTIDKWFSFLYEFS